MDAGAAVAARLARLEGAMAVEHELRMLALRDWYADRYAELRDMVRHSMGADSLETLDVAPQTFMAAFLDDEAGKFPQVAAALGRLFERGQYLVTWRELAYHVARQYRLPKESTLFGYCGPLVLTILMMARHECRVALPAYSRGDALKLLSDIGPALVFCHVMRAGGAPVVEALLVPPATQQQADWLNAVLPLVASALNNRELFELIWHLPTSYNTSARIAALGPRIDAAQKALRAPSQLSAKHPPRPHLQAAAHAHE